MKDKIVYMLLTIGLVWGAIACEDKDFEGIVSNTDDYVSKREVIITKEEVLMSAIMIVHVLFQD